MTNMKKTHLLIGLFALFSLGLGISCSQPLTNYASAEDNVNEVATTPNDEEPKEELGENGGGEELGSETGNEAEEPKEEPSVVETIVNEYQEIRETIIGVLNQPIVIGGVSCSLGALILWALSKLFRALKTKKIKNLIVKIDNCTQLMANAVSKKDYEALVVQYNKLLPVAQELARQVKNVNVRENVEQLLLECKPIALDCKGFAKEEAQVVIEDTKAFVKEEIGKTTLTDILNKD